MAYKPNEEHNDELQGYHVMTWDDGSEYAGEWMDGLRHGCGKYTDREGNCYDGSWNYDLEHGFGTYRTVDGHIYEGEHINGLKHGYGVYTWPSGERYEGNWFKGKKNGYGAYYWSNGDRYEGQWKYNDRHGHGKHISSDGSCMEGRWGEDFFIEEDTDLLDMEDDDYEERDNLCQVENELIFEGDEPESLINDELEFAVQELIKQGIADGKISYKDIICKLQPYELSVEALGNICDRIEEHGIEVVDSIEVGQDELKDDFFEPSFELNDDDEASEEELESEDEPLKSYDGEELEELDYEIEKDEIDWGEQLDEEGLLNNIEVVAQSSLNNYEPLLKLADINLYKYNVFRVLGQPVDASEKTINREVKKIKKQLKHNIDIDSSQVIKLPKLPQEKYKFDEDLINGALSRIKEPEYRLIDELFWFWPLKQDDSFNDDGLSALKNGDFARSYSIWESLSNDGNYVAIHNQAALLLYWVLQMESYAQQRELSKEQLKKKHILWQNVYDNWHACVLNDKIWGHLEARVNDIDDPRLKPNIALELRNNVILFLVYLNLELAIKVVLSNNVSLAEQYIEMINKSNIDELTIEKVKVEKVSQCIKDFDYKLDEADNLTKQKPEKGLQTLIKLANHIRTDLLLLKVILTDDNPTFQNFVYKKQEVFKRIARAHINFKYAFAIEESKNYPEDGNSIAEKMYKDAVQEIKKLKANIPDCPDIISFISNEIANTMNISLVNYCYNGGDPEVARRTLEKAYELASDEADKQVIKEGLDTLDTHYKCCFCKKNKYYDSSAYKLIIFKNVAPALLLNPSENDHQPELLELTLPRCFDCQEKHKKLVVVGSQEKNVGGVGIAFGGLFGLFVSLPAQSFIFTLISMAFFTWIGITAGNFLGDKIKKKEWIDEANIEEINFPLLEKLKREGWKPLIKH